jgi:ParB family transcriptional regulator, chromosome partitioning protein
MNSAHTLSLASAHAVLLRCAASDIDIGGPWLFWSAPPSPSLRRSLERQGQLVPVLVDASGARPVLVAGSARVSVLAELGRDVLCLDLGATDGLARGIAYAQSNAGREISDGQVVLAMRYFQTLPDADQDSVLNALGLEPRSKRLRLVRSWLSLPAHWDAFLCAGAVPLACADLLEAFAPNDRQSLEVLFATLSWSRGNAVNVLTWIREICLRDGACVAGVLEEAGVKDILAGGLSPKDAMSRITQEVRLLRYPALSGMERDFQEAARKVSAGTRWRVTQPDLFESDAVELSVRLTSPSELGAASAELARIAAREDLEALFLAGRK